MPDLSVARITELESLVDPLWDSLQRVRRQSPKAANDEEVRELARARRELQQRIKQLNERIERALIKDEMLKALPVMLRRTAGELRDAASRIRGVRSALDRTADLLRLADRVLEILV